MRILVTGGAGFLGTALANKLVQEGHIVRVLDDLSAGDASYLDKDILFSRGDTRDIPRLWSLLKDVDCVYHLAARVSVPESIAYPVEYNDVNVGGTVSLMTAVRDARVKRVVLASSAAVYGNQAQQPISESAVLQPESPYAVSKVAAENYVQAIGKLWGIENGYPAHSKRLWSQSAAAGLACAGCAAVSQTSVFGGIGHSLWKRASDA